MRRKLVIEQGVNEEVEAEGKDINYHLEDQSDDEDEGRRPAALPVGGVLVAAC